MTPIVPDIFLKSPRSRILLLLLSWATVCFATEPPITDLVFSPDGDAVVAVSQAGVDVFSWPNLKKLRRIKASAANLHCVRFSPDGKRLAIGGGNPAESGTVEVIDWRTGEPLLTLDDHEDSVTSLQWRTNDQIVSAGLDRAIYLSDVVAPEATRTLTGHSRGLNAICVLAGGETLVSAGADQSVRVWNLKSGQLLRSLNQHSKPIHAAAVRPNDSGLPMVATAAEDRTIRFWQPTIGRMVRYVRLSAVPLDLAWSPDGSLIAAACDDGSVRIVDPDEVTVLDSVPTIKGWAYGIAAHPTDGSLAVGGTNGLVRRVQWKQKK